MTYWVEIITCIMFVIILACGFKQRDPSDRYARLAVGTMIAQGLFAIISCAYTPLTLPGLAFSLALTIWAHHYIIHNVNQEPDLSEPTCISLQLHDISNHETWIVASITAALAWMYRGWLGC